MGSFHVECVWNVMAHTQKPDFVFRRNGRFRLNRRGRQFSRLLAAEVCASALVMLITPRSEVVWRVLATHSIRQFPLHFPSRASPCAIRFQTHSTYAVLSQSDQHFYPNDGGSRFFRNVGTVSCNYRRHTSVTTDRTSDVTVRRSWRH